MNLALPVIVVLYSVGWSRLSKLVSGGRLAAFIAGIAILWLAMDSPLAELDHHLLTAHMVQHLLIMIGAAPLVLLGEPWIVLPRIAAPHGRAFPTRFGWGLGRICGLAFCWLAGTVTVIVWHIPAVFQLARGSHYWHGIERGSFLLAGLLFWSPIVAPRRSSAGSPRWWIPLYLFLATLPCDALSAFLVFCDRVVYRPYVSMSGPFNLSPLQDQNLAGALMWVTVTFAYLVPALVATFQVLSGPASIRCVPAVPENGELSLSRQSARFSEGSCDLRA